jgi:hypothetical protein
MSKQPLVIAPKKYEVSSEALPQGRIAKQHFATASPPERVRIHGSFSEMIHRLKEDVRSWYELRRLDHLPAAAVDARPARSFAI